MRWFEYRKVGSKAAVLYFLLFLVSLSAIDVAISGARYIKYAILPAAILIWMCGGLSIRKPKESILYCFLIYLVYSIVTLFWGNFSLGVKDVFFVLSYTAPFLLISTPNISIKKIFYMYAALFLLATPFQEFRSFSISDSVSFFEGNPSFIFGVFLIAFTMKRKYILAAICFLFVLLTLKRIALLAVFLCVAIWFLPERYKYALASRNSILVVNCVLLIGLFLLTSGALNEYIFSLSGKGASEFTLGRTFLYSGVVNDVMENPMRIIFGNGVGSAYEMGMLHYEHANYAITPNLHSDTLKIFYENGVIFFIGFFFLLGSVTKIESRILMLYLSVLFSTDNVLIYADVMFVFLLLVVLMERYGSDGEPGRKENIINKDGKFVATASRRCWK